MIFVALAEALVILALLSIFGSTVRILVRQHARERALLVNQLLYATGRTWEAPPSEEAQAETQEKRRQTIPLPEQIP